MKAEKRRAVPMRLQRDAALDLCTDLMRKLGMVPVDYVPEFELHHEPPLELRPIDEATGQHVPHQHERTCLIWMTKAAHRARTTGRRGESDLSLRDGDQAKIAKTRRLEKKRDAFKRTLLARDAGEEPPPDKRKRPIPAARKPERPAQRRATAPIDKLQLLYRRPQP
jgi:hypothetical protein